MDKYFDNKSGSLFRSHMGNIEFRLLERCSYRTQILLYFMYCYKGIQIFVRV